MITRLAGDSTTTPRPLRSAKIAPAPGGRLIPFFTIISKSRGTGVYCIFSVTAKPHSLPRALHLTAHVDPLKGAICFHVPHVLFMTVGGRG